MDQDRTSQDPIPNRQAAAPSGSRYGWMRRSMTMRALLVAILVLLLLIPLAMVQDLIREREYRKDDAVKEVSGNWGMSQTITGPVISVPFKASVKVELENGRSEMRDVTQYAHFLPEVLDVNAELDPEKRHRGIYDVVVYKGHVGLTAKFGRLATTTLRTAGPLQWENASLCLGVSDLRSIKELGGRIGPAQFDFEPGVPSDDLIGSGLSRRFPLDSAMLSGTLDLSIDMDLNGSGSFRIVPTGRTTKATIVSAWSDPSFQGAFLPDSSNIMLAGFSASWTVLHLNRPYPQEFVGGRSSELEASAFGTDLILPVDEFQKSTRAAKYGLMLIVMVFLVFFFVEVLQKLRIHPIQYLLVGLALCIFYSLLIALSEQIGFGWAYVVSAVAVISLVVFYAKSVFKNIRATQLLGSVMVLVFGFMFTVINQEDYALLIGSIGLFIVLAIVMGISRKIDWEHVAD